MAPDVLRQLLAFAPDDREVIDNVYFELNEAKVLMLVEIKLKLSLVVHLRSIQLSGHY